MDFVSLVARTTARRVFFITLLLLAAGAGVSRWGLHETASAQTTVTVVNGASFANDAQRALTPDGIAAVFGTFVTQNNQAYNAASVPLPTTLGGLRATINNNNAGLFFAGPGQVNLLIPANIPDGDATIVVTNSDNTTRTGTFRVVRGAPGVFTARATGQGTAAAETTTDGINFQSTANPDGSEREVSAGTSSNPNFLVLYTTGLRYTPATNPTDGNGVAESVTVKIQGVSARVDFAGPHSLFVGVDQINVVIPPELSGFGIVRVSVTTNNRKSNDVTMRLGGDFVRVRLTRINFGETRTGQLTNDDQVQPGEVAGTTYFFDGYDFTTTAPNTTVAVDMRSTQFNAGLILYRIESNDVLTFIGADDILGGLGNGDLVNDNALLLNVIPTPGRYAIFATSSDEQPNGTGNYTLVLRNVNAPQLNYGQSVNNAAIEAADLQTSAGDFLDIYWFNGAANDNVRINMNSSAFDSFLLMQPNDNNEDDFAFDDNTGGGNNAQITKRVTRNFIYIIIATPFAPNITGAYTLSLNRLSSAPSEFAEADLFKAPGRFDGEKSRVRVRRVGTNRSIEE